MTDFFIIGAAKAGTTTLYNWLRQQGSVALPDVKEPHYFCFAGRTLRSVGKHVDRHYARQMAFTPKQYEKLFDKAAPEAIRGDASPGYLHFLHTAPAIRKHNPAARIVCILRDPVDRAFSQFMHHRRDGFEPIKKFSDALDAEKSRRRNDWWWGFHYRNAGLYHDRLKAYYDNFPSNQILVLKQEHLSSQPADALRQVMRHIGAGEPADIDLTARANVSSQLTSVPRFRWLQHMARSGSTMDQLLHTVLSGDIAAQVKGSLTALNTARAPTFPRPLREALQDFYHGDLLATERLTGLDLSEWRGSPKSGTCPVRRADLLAEPVLRSPARSLLS